MSFYQTNLLEDRGLVKVYECKISGFEIGNSVEEKLKELQATAHLKGFRKGKAPMSIIQESYFGKVFYDVVNKFANDAISQTAEENKLTLATSPKTELDAESSLPADRSTANIRDVSLKITYETLPEISGVDFSKINIEKFELNVAEDDVNEEIEKIAKNQATNTPKEGVIENGNVAIIDFTGYKDGEKFQGGEATDYKLEIGSKSFIEGFEEGLVGLKTGEEKTLALKFPDEYQSEELAGKEVEFKVVVKAIEEKVPALINDELVKKVGFETLGALKEDIVKSLKENYENSYKNLKKNEVFDSLKGLLNFELPPVMQPKAEEGKEIENLEEQLSSIRLSVFLTKYAKDEKIEVSQQDFMQYISTMAKMYGQNPKMIFDLYEKNQQMKESIYNLLYENKIYDKIFEGIEIEKKLLSKDEYDAKLKELQARAQKEEAQAEHVHDENCEHEHA